MWAENDFPPPGQPRLASLDVPGDDKVYTMYHGTSKQAADIIMKTGFKQSSGGMLGLGVSLSRDLQRARRYPLELPESQRVILKVGVNVGEVIIIDHQGHPLQKSWHYHGSASPRLASLDAPGDNGVYTMYHGTSKQAAAIIMETGFKPSSDGMLGRGVYLSRDLQKASRYPLELDESQRVVFKVKVKVGKVIAINKQDHPLRMTWHYNGYNTAWCPPNCGMVPSGLEEDCVWDPKRIAIIDIISPKLCGGACRKCGTVCGK